MIKVVLSDNDTTLHTFAMLDGGATNNYMDTSFASTHKISLVKKSTPMLVQTVDGTPISSGPVTHITEVMDIKMGDHQEQIAFNIANLGVFPLILGIPWLRKHNPQIDWRKNRVVFNSATCLLKCNDPMKGLDSVTLQGLPTYPVETKPHGRTFPKIGEDAMLNDEMTVPNDGGGIGEKVADVKPCAPRIALLTAAAFKRAAKGENVMLIRVQSTGAGDVIAMDQSQPTSDDDISLAGLVPSKYHEFLDLFSKKEADKLPSHTDFDHKIDLLEGKSAPWGPLYAMSGSELAELSRWLNENLAKSFIRQSTSPAGAPILFVKKKDGSLRLCVDYRGLNNVTKLNRSPIPLIQETLDRLNGSKVFTKLDLRGAYNLLRIREGDEWKTAFRTRYGLFEFLVMPFGLTGAPGTFQSAINNVLRPYLDVFVVVYMDDILIYSHDKDKHEEHVMMVLEKLREHSLYVKAEKCHFDAEQVEFLGFIINTDGVKMDPSKVQAVVDWPVPKSCHDIQVFNGFANFYRRFIGNYSALVAPLNRLLRKGVQFEWSDECQASFDELKRRFTTGPILRHFDPKRKIIIETDASDFALGAIISQHDDKNVLHPIAFHSRTYNAAECNYEIYDKEMLAIISAFKEWRHYCEGSQYPITVLCDHENLQYFKTTKQLSRRQARWYLFMTQFNFEILYRRGTASGKPDALSRRSDLKPGEDIVSVNNRVLLPPHHFVAALSRIEFQHEMRDRIIEGYEKDKDLQQIMSDLKRNKATKENSEYVLDGPLLMNRGMVTVPDADDLRLHVIEQCHDAQAAGHFGIAKTYELITRNFWWPGLRRYVKDYCKSCDTCNRAKPARHKPYGLLNSLPVPQRPWASISMDFVVKLPLSQGFDSVFVVVDRMTKMAHFIPCKEAMDATELARLFITNVFRLHGLPDDIVSDRGSLFTSKFWKKLSEMTGIKSKMSTAFHPETDGQTERVNSVMEQYLRGYVNYEQDNWSDLLPIAEFAYNNSWHNSSKMSPFMASYGYHPKSSFNVVPEYTNLHVPAAEHFTDSLHKLQDTLRAEISYAQATHKEASDENRLPNLRYKAGDKVWLVRRNIQTKRPSSKLDFKKLGPYEVKRAIGNIAYELELEPANRIHNVFHVNLLEPYHESKLRGTKQQVRPQVIMQNQEDWIVEEIIKAFYQGRKLRYLCHWEGYGARDRTIEDAQEIQEDFPEVVERFYNLHPDAPTALTR